MTDDFRPTASWPLLRKRAEMLARVRKFFFDQNFLEVQTPLLSADIVVDRHLDPLCVTLYRDPSCMDVGPRLWLQTSPEFAMKRLLAAGGEAIYQICSAFRAGEQGALHNPEFTMVEWYRPHDNMQQAIALLSELAQVTLGRGVASRACYRDVFFDRVGVDPFAASGEQLAKAADAHNITVGSDWPLDDRDIWLELLMSQLVQPHLGHAEPVVVYDYPASQAALAQVRMEDPPVAARFELFVDGVELANGYHELLDASELIQRNRAANAARIADGKEPLPEESRLLAAMRHGLPSCSGVALGFDRLMLVAAGAKDIAEVMAFPIDRA